MASADEWIQCRKEAQNFTRLLAYYRILGFAGFFFTIFMALYLNIFAPVVIGMGIVFLTFICVLDNKLSCYKDAASSRAAELERNFSGTPLSAHFHRAKSQLPLFHRYVVYVLYTVMIMFGFVLMWINLASRGSVYMNTFYQVAVLYAILYFYLLWEFAALRRLKKK